MGSLERRLKALEGLAPSEATQESAERGEAKAKARERLDELARLYRREGETIYGRTAVLQEQGHSQQDAMTIAKDEVLHAKNPELADFFDGPYPPEIRHDPIAKRGWLTSHIESRRASGRSWA